MTTAKTKATANTRMVHAERIIETLNDKNIKLSMLEYSDMIDTLINKYRLKPTVVEERTDLSLPHIYNLIQLAGMTHRMKGMIISGKIKATDALKILRKAKNEAEFIKYANEIARTKVDHRKRIAEQNRANTVSIAKSLSQKKVQVKKMVLEILGKENAKNTKQSTIDSLVTQLLAAS